MNMDRLNYRYWEHEVWNDPKTPLVPKYTNIVDGCDPTVAIGDFEFCTGLKDKNGNLIYEGDIVKTKTGSVYEIKWVETGFFAYDDGFINAIDFLECPEIIGNIHEQKDNK